MPKAMLDWTEVEKRIEKRISEESEIYDLDEDDIKEIRLEVYKDSGWSFDPCADEEDDGEDDEEPGPYQKGYSSYSLEDWYMEFGLSHKDFS